MAEKTTEETISELMKLIFGSATAQVKANSEAAVAAASLGGLYKALLKEGFDPDQAFTIVITTLQKSI